MAGASAREQLMLELVNRARLDPAGEAQRLGISLNQGLASGAISAAPKQVLAFNGLLNAAADDHSSWMLDANVFSHTGGAGSSPGDRMADAGYVFSGSWTWGENIAWSGTSGTMNGDSVARGHHDNLFRSPGHRANILNDDFHEIGIGSLTGVFTASGNNWNALMTTQNFARSGSATFVTGVIYDDNDDDDFYSIGEGEDGLAIRLAQNGTVIASGSSAAAGGYAIATTARGEAEASFAGKGAIVQLAGRNIKIDLVDGGTIQANVSAALTGAAENLRLIGIEDANGRGNRLDNGITGNGGGNFLAGGGGNDTLRGAGGDDRLAGSSGNDMLAGGAGFDRMNGGGGNDRFVFKAIADAAGGDLIAGFVQGADVIELSAIDAASGGGNDTFLFRQGAGASFTGAGQIRFVHEGERTIVEGDVNGGGADFSITLRGLYTLTADDFTL